MAITTVKQPINSLPLLKRTIVAFSLLLIVSFIAIKLAWSQPYTPDPVTDSSISFHKISVEGGYMNYAFAGDDSKPGIIFVHGTPGGWSAFERYLVSKYFQERFFMVSVDRFGWGESLANNGKVNGQFTAQAETIVQVMNQYPHKKWMVVGHSLGASLAPQIALQAPDQVNSLLLLAGSLSPKLGSPRWYNYAAKTWLVSKLVGSTMTNSNREIMALRKGLKKMVSELESTQLKVDVVIMQGLKDKLVSPKNAAYARDHWQDRFNSLEIIELPEDGHFLPWRQTPLVKQTILSLSKKTQLTDDTTQ